MRHSARIGADVHRVRTESVELQRFGSHGVTMHQPIAIDTEAGAAPTLLRTDGPATMVIAELTAGGLLGRHPAVGPQLLAVTSGTVRVSGGDDRMDLGAGDAVLFHAGEQHETQAVSAATVAILEWADSIERGPAG